MSAKNVDKTQPLPQHYCRISSFTGRAGGTEPSSSPVGTSKAGILLPQVYGA